MGVSGRGGRLLKVESDTDRDGAIDKRDIYAAAPGSPGGRRYWHEVKGGFGWTAMVMTRQVLAKQFSEYPQHNVTIEQLVDWVERQCWWRAWRYSGPAAVELKCDVLWTEDLADGQLLRGVRIRNPFFSVAETQLATAAER